MRRWLAVLFILVVAPDAGAQSSAAYYAFVGAGGTTSTFGRSTALFHFGGGAEATGQRGLGAGAEFGYIGPWSNGSNGVGLLSLNALYRFPQQSSIEPFVTGGYSLGFRSAAAHFGNIGGGINHWFNTTTGIRVELRDNIRDPATHWLTFRVGIAFR